MLQRNPPDARAAAPASLAVTSWNLENLVPYLGTGVGGAATGQPRPHLSTIARELGTPAVLCLQEVRLRPADAELIAAARGALPGYACELSLCRDARNVRFRGGRAHGVATYVRADLEAVHRKVAWDLEGRVLITTLPALELAVVNVYAVNGTAKPYYDHELERIEGDRHAFKRRFNERLMDECRQLQQQGHALLLIGDWNISRTKLDTYPRLRTEEPHALARAHFNERFIPGLDVVDVFRELHPDARAYTWFNRRTPPGKLDAARVDFALLSRSWLPRVVHAGIFEDPALRFGSDHAALHVTLST